MTIRTILLHVAAETCDPMSGPGTCALGLAKTFEARLTAPIYELDMALPRSVYGRRIPAKQVAAVIATPIRAVRKRSRNLQRGAAAFRLCTGRLVRAK